MKYLLKVFKTGLLTILPIALTVYLIYWLVVTFSTLFSKLGDQFLPPNLNAPGMAFLVGIIIIFLVGLILQLWFANAFKGWIDKLINSIPVVGDIYESVKGLMDYLSGNSGPKNSQTVLLELGPEKYHVLGLVTRDSLKNAPDGIKDDHKVAVYLPMSYQIGGYTLYVDRKQLKPVNMSKKQALKWALMAGVDK